MVVGVSVRRWPSDTTFHEAGRRGARVARPLISTHVEVGSLPSPDRRHSVLCEADPEGVECMHDYPEVQRERDRERIRVSMGWV